MSISLEYPKFFRELSEYKIEYYEDNIFEIKELGYIICISPSLKFHYENKLHIDAANNDYIDSIDFYLTKHNDREILVPIESLVLLKEDSQYVIPYDIAIREYGGSFNKIIHINIQNTKKNQKETIPIRKKYKLSRTKTCVNKSDISNFLTYLSNKNINYQMYETLYDKRLYTFEMEINNKKLKGFIRLYNSYGNTLRNTMVKDFNINDFDFMIYIKKRDTVSYYLVLLPNNNLGLPHINTNFNGINLINNKTFVDNECKIEYMLNNIVNNTNIDNNDNNDNKQIETVEIDYIKQFQQKYLTNIDYEIKKDRRCINIRIMNMYGSFRKLTKIKKSDSFVNVITKPIKNDFIIARDDNENFFLIFFPGKGPSINTNFKPTVIELNDDYLNRYCNIKKNLKYIRENSHAIGGNKHDIDGETILELKQKPKEEPGMVHGSTIIYQNTNKNKNNDKKYSITELMEIKNKFVKMIEERNFDEKIIYIDVWKDILDISEDALNMIINLSNLKNKGFIINNNRINHPIKVSKYGVIIPDTIINYVNNMLPVNTRLKFGDNINVQITDDYKIILSKA